mmetsp:Transcript_31321/g.78479  ORF Transcript_31321/g.78479 Transcript_31321/m.78479 type:complete len:201 (-) Transcript_31321:1116-1718(-)
MYGSTSASLRPSQKTPIVRNVHSRLLMFSSSSAVPHFIWAASMAASNAGGGGTAVGAAIMASSPVGTVPTSPSGVTLSAPPCMCVYAGNMSTAAAPATASAGFAAADVLSALSALAVASTSVAHFTYSVLAASTLGWPPGTSRLSLATMMPVFFTPNSAERAEAREVSTTNTAMSASMEPSVTSTTRHRTLSMTSKPVSV